MKISLSKWVHEEGSAYAFLLPYALLFIVFIVIPVIAAAGLSFTFFDAVQSPRFVGLDNYIALLTQDDTFMRYVLPNTLQFAAQYPAVCDHCGAGRLCISLPAGLDAGPASQDPAHDFRADSVFTVNDGGRGNDSCLAGVIQRRPDRVSQQFPDGTGTDA